MAATSAASAAAIHQRPNLPRLDTMLSTPPVEKNGISEPSSIGILRCRVDSSSTGCDGPSGQAEATARISLSICGHAPNPSPSIEIDTEGWRGRGKGENQAACFNWSILQKKSSCELGYCRRGDSPFVLGSKALGFPPTRYGWDEGVEAGGRVRIWSHAIVYIWTLLLTIFHFAVGYIGWVVGPCGRIKRPT
jgi:hypothetical protein